MRNYFALLILIGFFSIFNLTVTAQVVEVYDDPGTYEITVPPNVLSITVECWGGGGGGGAATDDDTGAAGGGGGAYARSTFSATQGQVISFSVGGGGIGATGILGNINGFNGGTTNFNSGQIIAPGGLGGGGNADGEAGLGGDLNDCVGDVIFGGGNGADGDGEDSGGGGGAGGSTEPGSDAIGHNGGAGGTQFGGNGADGSEAGGFADIGESGNSGSSFGGGGSGGRKASGMFAVSQPGGRGAAGAVRITYEFIPCTGTPSAGNAEISLQQGCTGLDMDLRITSTHYTSFFDGISYQWEFSTDGGTSWDDVAGGTNPALLYYTASSDIMFRLRVSCSHSGETDYSNEVTYQVSDCDDYHIDEHNVVNVCNALFYDSGGPDGNYQNNEDETITFCSDNSEYVRVQFLEFDTEDNDTYGRGQVRYDILYVYDGPDTDSPPLFEFAGTQSGGNIVPIVVSSQECITFNFTSNESTTRPGWKAHVSCTDKASQTASQFCETAPNICNLDGYFGNTSNFYNVERVDGQIQNSSTLFPSGALDNNSFVTFIAAEETVVLGVLVDNCFVGTGGTGVQFSVLQGSNCTGFTRVSNQTYVANGLDEGNHTMTLEDLTPGETYYVLVDGWNGAICDYYITAQSGVQMAELDVPDFGFFCEGEDITLTASGGDDYSWSGPDGFESDQAQVTVSDGGIYTVTISGGIPECPDEVVLSAFITPEECCEPGSVDEPVNPNDPEICEGDDIPELTVQLPPGYSEDDYRIVWYSDIEDGIVIASDTDSYTPPIDSEPGTYTYYAGVEEIGENCFSDRIPVELTILPSVFPEFDQLGPYCLGDSPDLLETTSDNDIEGTWEPEIIDTDIAGETTYVFTPSSSEQCVQEFEMDIFVEDMITPTFDPHGDYCQDETPNNLETISNNGISGTWEPSQIDTGSDGTSTYTFSPDESHCASIVEIDITVEPIIPPTFDSFGPYCLDETPDVLPGTSNNGINGTWSPEIIITDTEGTTQHTFTPSGGQCSESISIDITVEELITPSFPDFGPYCQGETPDALNTTCDNNISGTWEPSTINTDDYGTHDYTFTPEPDQCSEPITISVQVEELITPDFDDYGPYCQGETADNLPNTSENAITGTWNPETIDTGNFGTYDYTFTPTVEYCAVEVTINIEVEELLTPVFDDYGPYCQGESPDTLPLQSNNSISGTWMPDEISTDSAGIHQYMFEPAEQFCAEDISISVEVEEHIVPSFEDFGPYCQGETGIELPELSENGITGSWNPPAVNTDDHGADNYTFTPTDGQCSEPVTVEILIEELISPVFDEYGPYCQNEEADELPSESNNNISGTWTPSEVDTEDAGTHSYTFSPSAEYCAEQSIISVVVIEYLTAEFTHPGDYCIGDTPVDLPEVSDNDITGTWEPSEINTDYEDQIEYVFTPDSDEYLCANSTTMIINVYDYPDLSVWIDNDELQSTEEAEITASGADSYLWTPEGELSCDDCYNPIFTAPDQTLEDDTLVFYVYGTSNNCTSMDSVVIKLIKDAEILIPEGFSPNGDGIGDVWEIEGALSYPENEVVVFNRWGNEVFRASPYMNDWEGVNTSGGQLPAGTYYYVFMPNKNRDETMTGYVYIHY